MSSSARLSQFVEPKLDAARKARQYSAISERLSAGGSRTPLWIALAAGTLLGVLVAGAVFALRAPGALPAAVAVLETAESGQTLTLAEGSRVELDANTRLTLTRVEAKDVLLELGGGGVSVEAAHRPERRFVVRAGGYDVSVVGTRFSVRLDSSRGRALDVGVERGVVSVARVDGGDARRLGAGERWSVQLEPPPATASAAEPAVPTQEPEPGEPAPAELATAPADSAVPAHAAKPVARVETAKQLFDRAQQARAAGRNAEAKAAFTELRRRYPKDARASLAAFELARLELDGKQDPKRAVSLLDDALKTAPHGAPHREDVEARRVEALGAAGDVAACKKARDAYLARYSKGLYRARVTKACP